MNENDVFNRAKRLNLVYDELKSQGLFQDQEDFGNLIDRHRVSVSNALNGKKLTRKFLLAVSSTFPQYTFNWLMYGDEKPKPNLKKVVAKQIGIHYLDRENQEKYLKSYYSDDFVNQMPKIMVQVEDDGIFIAYEVSDSSMAPLYSLGDRVVCKEIERSEWSGEMDVKNRDVAIAHNEIGIIFRRVISHEVLNGLLMCKSKEGMIDISLKDVAHLYYIIEHRISGENLQKRMDLL